MAKQKAAAVKSALQQAHEQRESQRKEQGQEYRSVIERIARGDSVSDSLVEACRGYARQQGHNFDQDVAALSQVHIWETQHPDWQNEAESLIDRSLKIIKDIEQLKSETQDKISKLQQSQQSCYYEAIRVGSIGSQRKVIERDHPHLF